MEFPNYFADAESDFKNAEYVIFGVPYDKTGSFRRGTKKAPYSIRQASWNFESYSLLTDVDLKETKIHDYGDINLPDNQDSLKMKKQVIDLTRKIIVNKKIPIAIGGEHSITQPIIDVFKKEKDEFGVVILDAHLDFRGSYENNPENHACISKRISDLIGSRNISILGVRSGTKEEFKEAEKLGLFFINSFDINKNGIEWAIQKTLKNFDKKHIYLSLDFDVIDPSFAPGTSTPEPFGLNPFDILRCIEAFSSQIIGFDIVEVCPPYDKGETAILAAKLIRYTIEQSWLNKGSRLI